MGDTIATPGKSPRILLILAIVLAPMGLYLALDLYRMVALYDTLETVSVKATELTIEPLKRDGLEILVQGVPSGSLVLRERIHGPSNDLVAAMTQATELELSYELSEPWIAMQPVGTVWQMRLDGRIVIDPARVLLARHKAALPSGLLGLLILFLVIPAVLVLRRHSI